MKKAQIEIGSVYAVKVSGKVVPVKILSECSRGGWVGINQKTRRQVYIRSAQKCRVELAKCDVHKVWFPRVVCCAECGCKGVEK